MIRTGRSRKPRPFSSARKNAKKGSDHFLAFFLGEQGLERRIERAILAIACTVSIEGRRVGTERSFVMHGPGTGVPYARVDARGDSTQKRGPEHRRVRDARGPDGHLEDVRQR